MLQRTKCPSTQAASDNVAKLSAGMLSCCRNTNVLAVKRVEALAVGRVDCFAVDKD